MKYLRFTVDVEVDEGECVTTQLVNEVSDTLEAVIDDYYPAWIEYKGIVSDSGRRY